MSRLPARICGAVVRTRCAWVLRAAIFCLGGAVWGAPCAAAGATYGQEVLAAVLLAEARGEGDAGMRAVAEVVRRRADTLGVSMLAVLKPGAFSSLNDTTRDELLKRFRRHRLFKRALEIARTAYNRPELLGNSTFGANHFTHRSERPYWAMGQHPVVIIGNHAFYRLPLTPG